MAAALRPTRPVAPTSALALVDGAAGAGGDDALRWAARDFAPTTLAELGGAALMDRVDTKFVLPAALAPELLRAVAGHYRALEIAGERLCRYETLYYDTADLALYHAHHAGRGTRRKVRRRSYVDCDQHFLEVKLRGNDGRTRKARVPLDGSAADALDRLDEAPLRALAGALAAAELRPVVRVDYTRLTLVRHDGAERVTLDARLAVAGMGGAGGAAAFPGVVVVEVKQARRAGSPLAAALRALGVREGSLSKYCLGVATLEPRAKSNRFRPQLRHLHRAAGAPPASHGPAAIAL